MKISLLVLTSFFLFKGIAQNLTNEVWLTTGVKYNLNKTVTLGVDITQRYGTYGLETFFPQLSFRYKLNKWIKPSIDYRFIGSRDFDAPMLFSHRINGNLQFSWSKKRLYLGLRSRYQYSFTAISGNTDAEFDKAFRLKPSISYDIPNFPFSPTLSTDWFYSLNNTSIGTNRFRHSISLELDANNSHSFDFGLLLDQWVNDVPRWRFMYSLGYTYNFKSKEQTPLKPKNLRDL